MFLNHWKWDVNICLKLSSVFKTSYLRPYPATLPFVVWDGLSSWALFCLIALSSGMVTAFVFTSSVGDLLVGFQSGRGWSEVTSQKTIHLIARQMEPNWMFSVEVLQPKREGDGLLQPRGPVFWHFEANGSIWGVYLIISRPFARWEWD